MSVANQKAINLKVVETLHFNHKPQGNLLVLNNSSGVIIWESWSSVANFMAINPIFSEILQLRHRQWSLPSLLFASHYTYLTKTLTELT